MTTTYRRTNTDSDLAGGASFNKAILLPASDTTGSQVVNVGNNSTVIARAFTASGIPGADGVTGNYTVELEGLVGNNNIALSVQLHRINSVGTIQTSSTISAEQTATAGTKTFSFTSLNLGTWASNDRLRIDYRYRNTAHGGQDFTVTHGGTNNEVVAPWTLTEPPVNLGSPDSAVVANATSDSSVTQAHSIAPDSMVVVNVTSDSSVTEGSTSVTESERGTASFTLSYLVIDSIVVANVTSDSSLTHKHSIAPDSLVVANATSNSSVADTIYTVSEWTDYLEATTVAGAINLGNPDGVVVANDVTSPTLAQGSEGAPNGLTVEGVVSSPTVTQAHSAAPGAASVDAVVSEPTVAQAHDLAPDSLISVSDVTEPGLQQEGALNPDNQAVHSFVSEPTLSQGHELTANSIDCVTEVSAPQLIEDYKLDGDDSVVASHISEPILTQAHNLHPADLFSITTSAGGTLSQVGEANPDDIASNNTVSSPNLTQSHSIQAESLTSTSAVSDSSLTQAHSIVLDSLVSTTFAGSPTISQEGELGADDVAVVNTVSSPNITQNYALTAEGVSVSSEVISPSTATDTGIAPANVFVTSTIEGSTLNQRHNLSPNSLTVTNVTESPGISTAGDIVVDGDVVNTFISEPALIQASEINVFNIDIVTTVSTTTVFEPTLVTYGIGSPVVSVTVYQVTPDLWPESFDEIHSTITSPTLLQNHVDLGTPHTLIIENFTSSPTAGIPPIVEVGVAPGYPKIDDEPATVALDAEFDVLPVFDPVAASTSRLDAQQDAEAGIQMVFFNTVKIDDQPNEVRIG